MEARGRGARGETGSAAGEGRDGWLPRASAGVPNPPGARFDPYGPVPGMGGPLRGFGPLGGFDGDPRFAPGPRGPPELVNPDVEFGGVPDGFYPIAPGAGAAGARGARVPPGWPGAGGAPRWNPDLGPPPEG